VSATNWTVSIAGTDFTSSVLSLSLEIGRRTFFDDWSGGKIAITIRNQNGQCADIAQFDTIQLQDFSYFYVTNISFNDAIADNASTCVVTGIDVITTLSQYYWDTSTSSIDEALQYIYDTFTATVIGPPYMDPPTLSRTETNNSGIDTGPSTLLNFFSSIMLGECGAFTANTSTITLRSFNSPVTGDWNFVLDGGTGIPYFMLDRMAGTDLPASQVTINYQSGESVYNNTDPSNFRRNYTRYTQLLPSTAASQAEFYAKALVEPTLISGSLSWFDYAADPSVNGDWASSFGTIPGDFATLAYKLPGQGASSAFVKIEGISCQATPSQTMWTVYFTDSRLFGFVLNSEYNGVLGGTGIYYNSQINYDEVGYTYNDNVADNGSRLGW
jgi:hypothetical protein